MLFPPSHTDIDISNLRWQCFSRLLISKAYTPAAILKFPTSVLCFVSSHFILSWRFRPCGTQCLSRNSGFRHSVRSETDRLSLVFMRENTLSGWQAWIKTELRLILNKKDQRWRQDGSQWSRRAGCWCDASDEDDWRIVVRKESW